MSSKDFRNGYGAFTPDGTEYVIDLRSGGTLPLTPPPQPWVNVIANERFGLILSETGSSSTWSGNSREHRLTPWSNDPVTDPHGEALYIRDEETGAFWSPLPGPVPGAGRYEARHAFAHSRFLHVDDGLEEATLVFVPREDPLRITRLRITNQTERARRLSIYSYARLVLGRLPEEDGRFVVTEIDEETGAVFARNRMAGEFAEAVAFAATLTPQDARAVQFTCDRASFIGRDESPARPGALLRSGPLDGACGAGLDPCFAQRIEIELAANATIEVSFLLGEGASAAEASALASRYRAPGVIEEGLREVRRFWAAATSGIRIETPDPALDVMVNGWLPYQTLACRMWARAAFYQSGGAFGFRDQIQDAAALIYTRPDLTRAQILLHARHQFVEGDVLHWWHPPLSRGIRTRFADDLLWLPYVTAFYVSSTGDRGVLEETPAFLTARPLRDGEDEALVLPRESGSSASVYEHCCRAIDRSLSTGAHGLPLFGTGDWNDGMNRVGREGRGESVWMGFFLYRVIGDFLPICEERGDRERVARYDAFRRHLRTALNEHAWDGEWYLRGYYDSGAPLGSHQNDECRVDALAQAWAVISGAAPPDRARQAIDSVERHLVSEDDGLIRLLIPPFDSTPEDPGYIKGYAPGVRENGGQYTHAALWVVRAVAELARNNRAARLLRMLNPISHAQTPEQVAIYRLEPYVVAADVYGAPPHVGRGGWSWYTGSAGWMLRVAIESILGFHLENGITARIRPCIPDDWPGFTLVYRLPDGVTTYDVRVENPHGSGGLPAIALLDGEAVSIEDGGARIPITRDGRAHRIEIILGARSGSAA